MRERLRAHAVLAVLVTAVVAAPTAVGYSTGAGASPNAPGQVRADERCDHVTANQKFSHGHHFGWRGDGSPANCDHFFEP